MTHPPLQDRLDDLFETLFALRPVDASFVGRHEYDGALPDFSPSGVARHIAELDRLAGMFAAAQGKPAATTADLDERVAAGYLASQQALWQSYHAPYRDPSAITSLAILGVIGLLRRNFAPAPARLESALARVRGIPALLANAEVAAETAPEGWRETALSQCRAGIDLCRRGIVQFCLDHDLADPDPDALEAAARAFETLAETLSRADGPSGRTAACGRALLDLMLEKTHHVVGGSSAVEAMALDELETAKTALSTHALALGEDWQAVVARAQNDRVPEPELAARHRQIFERQRDLAIEKGLVSWPDYPLEFMAPPDWLSEIMGAAGVYPYHAAAPLDPDVPVEFIIPPAPDGTAEITILSNHVLHHAGIGHHVQNWFAYNRAETRFGKLSAVDSAGYIFIHSGIGMAEGWASYVPEMMAEFGIADARQTLCMQFDRLRSASRALVDVRLHCGIWSADDAADFLIAETGASSAAARAAVRRISHSPSSGSMYCVGPTLVRRLRTALLGERPTAGKLGRFHDAFLAFGSLPVPLIAAAMTGRPQDALRS